MDQITDDLCPGCFTEKGRTNPCPHCGYDETAQRATFLLPHRTLLNGQFIVGRVLGKPGGFGVTYLGWDLSLADPGRDQGIPAARSGRADHRPRDHRPPLARRGRAVPLRAGAVPARGAHPGPARPPQHRAGPPLLRGQRHRLSGDGLLPRPVAGRVPGTSRRAPARGASQGHPGCRSSTACGPSTPRASCTATSSPRTSIWRVPRAVGRARSCSTSAPPVRPWASAAAHSRYS